MRGRRLVPCLWLLFAATPARADEGTLPLVLEWQAPEECYSAEDVRTELSRIARVRKGRVPSELSAHGRIERKGKEYRLSLTTERNGIVGERSLVSSECRSLGREVTLVLALAFGEGVELVPDEPPDAAESEPAAKPPAEAARPAVRTVKKAPKPVTRAAREPRAASPKGFRAAAYAGAGLLWKALPEPALQVSLGAELGAEHWWFSPRLNLVPTVTDSLERGVEARYDAAGAALSFCGGSPLGSFSVAGCAALAATAVRGRSTGATESGSATAPWYAAGPAVSVGWPSSTLISLRLEAALLVSLNRPRYVVDGLGEAHEIPLFVANPSLSVVLKP